MRENEGSSDPITNAIVQNDKFVFVNHSVIEKFGYIHWREILERLYISVVHNEAQYELRKLMEIADHGISRQSMKGKFSRLNGTVFFAEFILLHILFTGKPAGYIKYNDLSGENGIDIGIIKSHNDRFSAILKKIYWN